MSRKMIDYHVEGGKITSIDGYKVGGDEVGGDEVGGDKLYTKPNSGITLTEEEGKQYISSNLVYTTKRIELYPVFHAGEHTAGEKVAGQSFNIDGLYISGNFSETDNTRVVVVDNVAIMRIAIPEVDRTGYRIKFEWYALNNGNITKDKQIFAYTGFIIAKNAKREA